MKQLLLSILLATVSAAPNVVADYRIRNPDITPALGRGYSLTTYDVLSTCLEFTGKTQASYNYDYDMVEYTTEGAAKTTMSGSMKASVSYGFMKGEVSGDVSKESESSRKTHYVATRMATERYYSSIDDTTAKLTPDALGLVQRGDLVGFFQACGSGYIRSIRRTAEIAAVFAFSSSSTTTSASMAAKLTASTGGGGQWWNPSPSGSVESKSEYSSTSSSSDELTRIKIKGFGLGLNADGADSLVATNIEDYHKAMKFAFKSMQNDEVGMIHGVEIVSWMNNLQFQNAVKFTRTEKIEWLPASSDPSSPAHKVLVRTVGQGPLLTPEKGQPASDNYVPAEGSRRAVGNPASEDYAPATYAPLWVEAVEVKAITMINAEFVTNLEAYYRKESYTVSKLIACKAEVNTLIALKQGNYYLQDHTRLDLSTVSRHNVWTVDQAYEITSSRDTLNKRLDSLQNFVKHFYGKCASAISKHSNDGSMTKYWWDLEECMPAGDGSIPGDANSPTLECLEGDKDFIYEASEEDNTSGTLLCKAQEAPPGSTGTSGMNNFIARYCMPEIDYTVLPKPCVNEATCEKPEAP